MKSPWKYVVRSGSAWACTTYDIGTTLTPGVVDRYFSNSTYHLGHVCSSLNFPWPPALLMVSSWSASTFLSMAQSKDIPRKALYSLASAIPVRDNVPEQRISSWSQCMMPRVYFTRLIPNLIRPWAVFLLEKPEAMSQILLTMRPKNSLNTSSPQMLLQLSSVPNPIHARSWSIGSLEGSGETTTAGTFDAMINMVSCTVVNII